MKHLSAAALTVFAGLLFFVVFCINTQNPFDPNNPDYALPSMTFEDFPVKDGDTTAADSLCFVVRGNYKENYFRWWKESPDSADTNWTEWSGNNRWNDTMILTKLREGGYRLHIQTAYHWNGDITDTSVTFYKVNTPRITNQSDTLIQIAVAVPCTVWVKASGTPQLAYQWYKDTAKIGGKTSDTLFFPSLTVSDTGRYRCAVSNKWGGDTSTFVRLSVSPRYRIYYEGNNATGGAVPVDSNYYKEGATVAVMGNTKGLVKTGCTFAGWNTAADGSGTSYAPGDAIVLGSADVTLFAKWATGLYTVTFNSMGGSAVPPQAVNPGGTVTKPSVPVKSGFSFTGWFKDSLYTSEWNFTSDTVTGNMTLFAKWVKKLDTAYTVTFNSMGGSAVPPQMVKHGDTATKPSAPAKADQVFAGWFRDSLCKTEWVFSSEAVTGSVTLYAKWIPKGASQYTVTFNSKGGSTVPPQVVNAGQKVTKPSAPTKAGNVFAGWFKDSLYKTEWNFLSDTVGGDLTLFAKWTPVYSITYDGNGSTGGKAPADSATYEQGASVTVKGNTGTLVKTGYTFAEWNTAADGSGTSYKPGDTFKLNSAGKVLFAKWTAIAYSVTYHLNGGVNHADNPVSYTIESLSIALLSATKTNFVFGGWFADSLFATPEVKSIPAGSTGDKTFYAKWVANAYSITYRLHGGTNHADNPTFYTTSSPAITLKDATKNGYAFGGWYADSLFATAVTTIPAGSSGNKTFYAKWTVVAYYITYVLNGGVNHADNPSSYTIESSAITLQPATRNGYTFGGWYADSLFVTPEVKTVPAGSAGNKRLYAKWITDGYSITYHLNGGVNHVDNPSSYTISSPTITLQPATRDGYAFGGWYSEATFTTQVTSIPSGSTGNKEFYAKWTITTYTITYTLNGGVNHTGNPPSYTIESATITLQPASRTGYLFGGWFSDPGFTTQVTAIPSGSTGNKAYYAKWNSYSYTVAFTADGATTPPNPAFKTVTSPATTVGTLPAAPERTGYDFGGWYTEPNGGGSQFTGTTPVTGNTTVHAKWSAITYTITYHLNGGVNNAGNPSTYTIATTPISLENATRSYFAFGGWYSDSLFTTQVTTIQFGSTGNKTFYAKWVVMDADGNTYTTVTIGNQVWTVENLKTTKFNDGSQIPPVPGDEDWKSLEGPGYCWHYNNENANKSTYGALYNWYAVNTGKLAPDGWRVPSNADWDTLQNYLVAHGYNWDGTTEGNELGKSMAAKTHWMSSGTPGHIGNDMVTNNRSGFTALPGGSRAGGGQFGGTGIWGYWWSSTAYGPNGAYGDYLASHVASLLNNDHYIKSGFSVRLVRN